MSRNGSGRQKATAGVLVAGTDRANGKHPPPRDQRRAEAVRRPRLRRYHGRRGGRRGRRLPGNDLCLARRQTRPARGRHRYRDHGSRRVDRGPADLADRCRPPAHRPRSAAGLGRGKLPHPGPDQPDPRRDPRRRRPRRVRRRTPGSTPDADDSTVLPPSPPSTCTAPCDPGSPSRRQLSATPPWSAPRCITCSSSSWAGHRRRTSNGSPNCWEPNCSPSPRERLARRLAITSSFLTRTSTQLTPAGRRTSASCPSVVPPRPRRGHPTTRHRRGPQFSQLTAAWPSAPVTTGCCCSRVSSGR